MSNGTASADGVKFGPTANGSYYISLYYHRSGNHSGKSIWHSGFLPLNEFKLFGDTESFAYSANSGWRTVSQPLWGVDNKGKTILGMRGERLAKFPHPQNANDPWHGYPVSPQHRQVDTPPDELIELWIERGVIKRVFGRRIQRRKV